MWPIVTTFGHVWPIVTRCDQMWPDVANKNIHGQRNQLMDGAYHNEWGDHLIWGYHLSWGDHLNLSYACQLLKNENWNEVNYEMHLNHLTWVDHLSQGTHLT